MAAHIVLAGPGPDPLDACDIQPADSSRSAEDHDRFGGLVYTDSMSMDAVAKMVEPGEGAVRALLAGADQCCTRRIRSPPSTASRRRWRGDVCRQRRSTASVEPRAAREGLGRVAPAARDRLTRCRRDRRRARERRRGGLCPVCHAGQRRPPASAADVPRDAPILYCRCSTTLPAGRIAAPSRTFSRAEEALAERDVDQVSVTPMSSSIWSAPSRRATVPSVRIVFRAFDVGQRPMDLGPSWVRL